ncbi:MAG: NADH-quinone oxidoreductase subunit J [Deltaproteobacteria bacterium]|nr:NADH-quinone oxidoreductase subunit J [Deltaproteobacteria bacterium]
MSDQLVFWGLAGFITLSSVAVVTVRNPVTAAVALVINLFLLAGVYAFQGADFVAAIQIIVYTGAIVVLFLFVIMILNLDPEHLRSPRPRIWEHLVLGVVIAGFAYIGYRFLDSLDVGKVASNRLPDNTYDVAMILFSNYLWPFEIVSILILLAIVGSVAIAKKPK